jgi:hypothetical protein
VPAIVDHGLVTLHITVKLHMSMHSSRLRQESGTQTPCQRIIVCGVPALGESLHSYHRLTLDPGPQFLAFTSARPPSDICCILKFDEKHQKRESIRTTIVVPNMDFDLILVASILVEALDPLGRVVAACLITTRGAV